MSTNIDEILKTFIIMNTKLPKNGEFKEDGIQISGFVGGHRVEEVKV